MDASRFEYIASLLKKHLNGELTTETEKAHWDKWIAETPDNRELVNRLEDAALLKEDLKIFYESKENILLKIGKSIPELSQESKKEKPATPVFNIFLQHRQLLKYAAAILLFAALSGVIWFNYRSHHKTTDQTVSAEILIQPGTNKAILTLSNGSKILLDSTHNGIIAHEDGAAISVKDNQVSYLADQSKSGVSYNTMTTPRGGQYKLLLPDGSAVWLNAQSSITYPVSFSPNERKVSVTGEVYFEVTKDPTRPFIVDMPNKTSIEVLGTHFNVNTYDEEPAMLVTLLEGSVRIANEINKQILRPKQQAKVNGTGSIHVFDLKDYELSEVMAWKNGAFYFMDADINTVMKQLARWYDFDVTYNGEVKEKFHLEMPRDTRVENVFKILEATRGVHFKIEGKKITVMP